MKLYTEEQVKHAIKMARSSHNIFTTPFMYDKDEIIEHFTPIQLPSDEEVWRWWQTQKFQKEQGEQEYTMLYEIDLPKILKSFTEHLIQGGNK